MTEKKEKKHVCKHPEDDFSQGWLRTQWRPAMAWSYMLICLFDFIIAPLGTSLLIAMKGANLPIWQSLTLSNGGVMHLAFGAILGVAAWGRTKESVIGSQFVPWGPGTTVYEQQTDVVVPMRRKPPDIQNDLPKNGPAAPNTPPPNLVVPKPKPPVIE